jgi:hypothetical protein
VTEQIDPNSEPRLAGRLTPGPAFTVHAYRDGADQFTSFGFNSRRFHFVTGSADPVEDTFQLGFEAGVIVRYPKV